jgi:flagellar basal body rod protein FlgC
MKKLFVLIFLTSCAHYKQAPEKEIDLHCQDLNTLYQKQAVIEANIANINTIRTIEGGYYNPKAISLCMAKRISKIKMGEKRK